MPLLERFLDSSQVSLKICGVTRATDGEGLAELGVDALGVNFWPKSKRFLDPAEGKWLADLTGRILRVGVFVNPEPELPMELYSKGWIDVVQLHGDETPQQASCYREAEIPFIKAVGVAGREHLAQATAYGAQALLMDAHAPGVYGGTGATFDWNTAVDFISEHPDMPVILAGGIVPENAREATATVHPAAIDVASGAELSPGIKDFTKVKRLLDATRS